MTPEQELADALAWMNHIVVVCPEDEWRIRDLPEFVPAERYGLLVPMLNEIGAVRGKRYVARVGEC